jgi:hypothetical protein
MALSAFFLLSCALYGVHLETPVSGLRLSVYVVSIHFELFS